jgi:protein-disulfide isomerase
MRLIPRMSLTVLLCLGLMSSVGVSSNAVTARTEPAPASQAEVDALRVELERVRTGLESIQQELASIRQRASHRPAPPVQPAETLVTVRPTGNPMLGSPEAPLTLIEFSDYQCPYCRKFSENTLPALKRDYIDTGKLRYVFRDFPLDRLHPEARKAAEAAHCAGEQGKYWEMHGLLFQHQRALQVENLKAYARQLGLRPGDFDACLGQGTYAAKVQEDYEAGVVAGVQGTPGFFLGRTRPDGMMQGTFIKGAQPVTAFQQAIERLLEAK